MKEENVVQNGAEETEERKHGAERASVGKIARLPKAIRELLNRRLEDGEPASSLVAWLNELQPVKQVLETYFGGAAISEKNISNWRLTGYKRWQERQEVLAEVKELAEEASDINESSGDGLIRMTATLACTKLLRSLRDEKSSPNDVVKIGFAIAALNNVELSRVRVQHEERRLDQKDELVTLAWDKHLRDCAAIALRVLKDAQAKAVAQAPVDYSVQIELIGRRMFGCLWRKRKLPGEDHIPGNVGDEKPDPDDGCQRADKTEGADTPSPQPDPLPSHPTGAEREQPSDGVRSSESQGHASVVRDGKDWTDGTDDPPVQSEPVNQSLVNSATSEPALSPALSPRRGESLANQGVTTVAVARADNVPAKPEAKPATDQQVSPTEGDLKFKISDLKMKTGPLADARGSVTTPANPYAGRTTQEIIAEAEEKYARERADRLNRRRQKEISEENAEAFGETPKAARAHACGDAALPVRELSAYEKALLEGKTHLEAMYAQATPV